MMIRWCGVDAHERRLQQREKKSKFKSWETNERFHFLAFPIVLIEGQRLTSTSTMNDNNNDNASDGVPSQRNKEIGKKEQKH